MTERINSSPSLRSARCNGYDRENSREGSEDPDYYELAEGIALRPPSGTNHQQPGSHLSVDTRNEQLSLGSDSWIAESEVAGRAWQFGTDDTVHGTRAQQRRYKVVARKPNCYIMSPFKQGPEPKKSGPVVVVDPSLELKERTRQSVERTKEKLKSARPPKVPVSPSSQLTKGRLRHMGRPMTASGPPIDRCQGIFAGRAVPRYSVCSPGPRPLFADSLRSPSEQSSRTPSPPSKSRSPRECLRPGDTSVPLNSCASSVQDSSCDCPTEDSDSVDVEHLIDAWTLRGGERELLFDQDADEVLRRSAAEFSRGEPFIAEKERENSESADKDVFERALRDSHGNGDEGMKKTAPTATTPTTVGSSQRNPDGISSREVDECRQGRGGSREEDGAEPAFCRRDVSQTPSSEKVEDVCAESFTRHHEVKARTNGVQHGSQEASYENTTEIGYDRPILEVHIRRGMTTTGGNTAIDCSLRNSGERTEDGLVFGADAVGDRLEDGEVDTDRIPSAFLWKTLDALSSADLGKDSHPSKFSSKFSSKPRSKSAGCRSSSRNANSGKKLSSKSRAERPKTTLNKGKMRTEREEVAGDSQFLLGQRAAPSLAAALPGYFTEQYRNLLDQQENADTAGSGGSEEDWALVKVESSKQLAVGEGGEIPGGAGDSYGPHGAGQGHGLERHEQSVGERSVSELQSSSGVFVTAEEREDSGLNSRTRSPEGSCCRVERSEDDATTRPDEAAEFGSTPEAAARTDDRFYDPSELEVVASAKQLSEPRYQKQKRALAPFPPVCFSINAHPPPGSVFYFAYGADMNPKRMAIYLRREIKSRLWGVLFGFKLRFNKRGNSVEAGGFPNVQFSPSDSVEGCVYTLSGVELSMLDNCVGYPKHFTRAVLPVWMLNCRDPSEHAVAQYCVPAVLYVAQDDWVVHGDEDTLDSKLSVGQCLKARDILSPNYVAFLASLLS